MTDDDFGKTKTDRQVAALGAFRAIYESGNPTGLHEALSYCAKSNLPLPSWLTSEVQNVLRSYFVGETNSQGGTPHTDLIRYRRHLREAVRVEAYQTVRRWQSNILRYKDMPTKCIHLWFEGKIGPKPNSMDAARRIALLGLEGTSFHCGIDNFARVIKAYEKRAKADVAEAGTPPDESPPPLDPAEYRNSHMLIGHWPSEIDYGLRKHGQIFGTEQDPPLEIQSQLEEQMGKKKLFFDPD